MPFDNQDLLEDCRKVYMQNCQLVATFSNSGAFFRSSQDAFNRVFVYLSPKDLAHFSKVSKCCYLATKADIIWEIQLQNCFPNVKTLPKQLCSFSPEQQFKIYFKRVNDELKPYNAQFERNNVVIGHLRGSNGFNGAIDQAWKEYQMLDGENAKSKFLDKFNAINQSAESKWEAISSNKGKAYQAYWHYNDLCQRLRELIGNTYNGTTESIDPQSQQGYCMNAIHEVPKTFDDQEKFEKTIQRSEAVKNNSSEYYEEAIPQNDSYQPWVYPDSTSVVTALIADSGSASNTDCIIS